MHKEEFAALPPYVIEFLNDPFRCQKRVPELTVLEYASDLRLFFRFLSVYRGLVPKDSDFEKIAIDFIDLDFIKTVKIADAYAFLSYLAEASVRTTMLQLQERFLQFVLFSSIFMLKSRLFPKIRWR